MTAAAAPWTPLAAEINLEIHAVGMVEVDMVAHMVAVVSIVLVDNASNVATMLMKSQM